MSQRFQFRAVRILTDANYDTHSADLLNTLSWDTLQNRRPSWQSALMYKYLYTKNRYMLFTGCEVRMRKTVPEVLKTARARRARDVFKTEGTVFLIRTERVYFLSILWTITTII